MYFARSCQHVKLITRKMVIEKRLPNAAAAVQSRVFCRVHMQCCTLSLPVRVLCSYIAHSRNCPCQRLVYTICGVTRGGGTGARDPRPLSGRVVRIGRDLRSVEKTIQDLRECGQWNGVESGQTPRWIIVSIAV